LLNYLNDMTTKMNALSKRDQSSNKSTSRENEE